MFTINQSFRIQYSGIIVNFILMDGVPNVRTCVTPLKEGMNIETQHGRGFVPLEVQ